jgi:ribosomal protein S14
MSELREKAEKALDFLASTDLSHAEAKAKLSALQEHRKTVKAAVYVDCVNAGRAQGLAEQLAYCSEKYREIIEQIEAAEIDAIELTNKRKRAELTIDIYRTESANSRRGNV